MGLVTIKMNRTINCILFLESFTNRTNEDEASSWHPQSVCTVLKSKVNEWLAIPSTYDLQVLSWCCFVNKLPYKCLTPHQHTWHLATLSECQQRKHLLFVLFFIFLCSWGSSFPVIQRQHCSSFFNSTSPKIPIHFPGHHLLQFIIPQSLSNYIAFRTPLNITETHKNTLRVKSISLN